MLLAYRRLTSRSGTEWPPRSTRSSIRTRHRSGVSSENEQNTDLVVAVLGLVDYFEVSTARQRRFNRETDLVGEIVRYSL